MAYQSRPRYSCILRRRAAVILEPTNRHAELVFQHVAAQVRFGSRIPEYAAATDQQRQTGLALQPCPVTQAHQRCFGNCFAAIFPRAGAPPTRQHNDGTDFIGDGGSGQARFE